MLSFDTIVKMSQKKLKKTLRIELNKMGYATVTDHGYLYAKGSVPVMLVAHMDTVHAQPVKTICKSADGRIVMSPEGIGGDDRAGVYMILQILKKHRCHVLFTEDEETGAKGAREFAKSTITPKINYMVQLDRRGNNDAVFYSCDNKDFTAFVTGFDFKEETGSFSDISVVAPALGVAAVNISAGYYHEHSKHEYVDMWSVRNIIERVSRMVSTKTDKYEYIEKVYQWSRFSYTYDGKSDWDDSDWSGYGSWWSDPPKSSRYTKWCMMLPETAVIKCDGEPVDDNSDGIYFTDFRGNVYGFSYDLGILILRVGYSATTEHGLPIKYDYKQAEAYEVITESYAEELLEEMQYGIKEDEVIEVCG